MNKHKSTLSVDMEIQIISKETIKPSSPTLDHFKTHKLSALDQTTISCHVPIILFYSPTTPETSMDTETIRENLKKSLSETLIHYYPLAGKSRSNCYIDCNDDGATFVEAHVACDMSDVMKQAQIQNLHKLLPCDPNENLDQFSVPELLLVQFNRFTCGGIAIGVCISHLIADASTLGTFVHNWSAKASGIYDNTSNVVYDCTTLFPPIDSIDFSWSSVVTKDSIKKTITKRFLFDGSKISALREKIGKGEYLDRPTRYEAVCALIWRSVIAAGREKAEENTVHHVAMSLVDLRKRLVPQLSPMSIGNICQLTTASTTTSPSQDNVIISHNELAGKIHESVKKITDEYVREYHLNGGVSKFLKSARESNGNIESKMDVFSFTSWCRFPFYEADFGWGRPVFVAPAMGHNKVAILLDTSDGEGIEAWVGLSKEDMVKFEANPDIVEYASFN